MLKNPLCPISYVLSRINSNLICSKVFVILVPYLIKQMINDLMLKFYYITSLFVEHYAVKFSAIFTMPGLIFKL